MYELWLEGQTEPIIFDDVGILHAYLHKNVTTQTVVVKRYDKILRETRVYNVFGGDSLPPNPANPPPSESVTLTHVRPKGI